MRVELIRACRGLFAVKMAGIQEFPRRPGFDYKSSKWQGLRAEVLIPGSVCAKCGSANQLQVDHIKPKSKHPELSYDINNLQVLCWPCNKAKAAR